jgi:hypothetical protein
LFPFYGSPYRRPRRATRERKNVSTSSMPAESGTGKPFGARAQISLHKSGAALPWKAVTQFLRYRVNHFGSHGILRREQTEDARAAHGIWQIASIRLAHPLPWR